MAGEALSPVSPRNVKVVAFGIPVVQYRSQGQYAVMRPVQDIANSTGGADGDLATVINLNNSAELTIRVIKNTSTYRLLRAAAVAFQQTGIFAPTSLIDIDDPLDTTYTQNSYIKAHSEDIFSTQSEDLFRAYTIFCHNVLRV